MYYTKITYCNFENLILKSKSLDKIEISHLISSLALCKHMCAVARADALLKVLMYYNFFGSRFLDFARNSGIFPRSGMRFLNLAPSHEIEESRQRALPRTYAYLRPRN